MNKRPLLSATSALSEGKVIKDISLLGVRVQLKQGKNLLCASFYVFHLKNLKNSAVDVSLPAILLRLHSLWSINTRWNVVYLLMGHTVNFGWLTSSGIVPKEHLERHDSVGP